MGIFCTSVSTFNLVFVLASVFFIKPLRANFDNGKWIFHYKDEEIQFENTVALEGINYLKLSELTKRFSLRIVKKNEETIKIVSDKTQLFSEISLRHKEIFSSWGNSSFSVIPRKLGEEILVPLEFGDRVLSPLLTKTPPLHPFPSVMPFEYDVVLDAGHGGNDYGTQTLFNGKEYLEKDLSLNLAQDLKEKLQEKGLKVLSTRDQDVYLALNERVAFANRYQAKLFLSFHFNYDPKKKLKGYQLYLLSLKEKDWNESKQALLMENMKIPDGLSNQEEKALSEFRADAHFKDSLKWAQIVNKSFQKKLKPADKKPIHVGPFYVLYGANMPALLIEAGYLNNAEDFHLWSDSKSRKNILSGLAQDIVNAMK